MIGDIEILYVDSRIVDTAGLFICEKNIILNFINNRSLIFEILEYFANRNILLQ